MRENRRKPVAPPVNTKPPIIIEGMWGVGDVIHQRAVLRELMKSHNVAIETHSVSPVYDLIKQGLGVIRGRLDPRIKENYIPTNRTPFPKGTTRKKINYEQRSIHRAGSILAAQFAAAGIAMPERPDFSLPIPDEWRAKAKTLMRSWDMGGKPLMVYRPIILNKVWHRPNRSPDPVAYDALYRSIRKHFFVVSVANLSAKEWIVGPQPDVDVRLHRGELDFETMAALCSEARIIFSNPGFMPVMAQAVGVPGIVVYGGNESSKTTQATGVHLAPTLLIDTDNPCDCHDYHHQCDKTITLPPAIARIREFVLEHVKPKILVFCTTYIDSNHKEKLIDHWLTTTIKLNPDCAIMVVDSNSPRKVINEKHGKFWGHTPGTRSDRMFYSFPDIENIYYVIVRWLERDKWLHNSFAVFHDKINNCL